MIIDKIIFKNFGTYLGEQTFYLTPKNVARPIILIGGLNGAGKTSLLNGVQLALFGKRSMTLSRGHGGYQKQLSNLMTWGAEYDDPTSVVLEFHASQRGTSEKLRVERSWEYNSAASIVETFKVWRNGKLDPELTENWDEYVERLIPVGISHLFFFDGEKVEQYAQSGRSKELLKTGVHALLGVDLVERLQKDVRALVRKKTKEAEDGSKLLKINFIEEEIESLENQLESLQVEHKDQSDNKLGIEKQLKAVEQRLTDAGVDLFYQKLELQKKLAKASHLKKQQKKELVEIAGGALPLRLVENLLNQMREQVRLEHDAVVSKEILATLKTRDRKTLALIGESDTRTKKALENFFFADQEKLAKSTKVNAVLNLSSEGQNLLQILKADIEQQLREFEKLQQIHKQIEGQIQATTAMLERVPKEEDLADMLQVRTRLEKRIKDAQIALIDLELKIGRTRNILDLKEQALKKEIENGAKSIEMLKEGGRIVKYGDLCLELVRKFQEKLVHNAIRKVEASIRESLALILRKEEFISDIHLDPKTYEMSLIGKNGKNLTPEMLSAGERQILIIATLWGLAKASERPLPVIIDTPLGRLDSVHRANLIEHYFPAASRQVILLSTDEEIDQAFDEKLKETRSHGYHLHFDPKLQATKVKSGYFWD
ncbi:DNA sulfur modification protein DndD [Desulfolutivibrio sp.]|uniref:DNA sulfur modification protein DndD n=1 Tax=Desulfolutivibrio sp. TaxID=2773296 RepID=UPI002F966847